jgi:hypothetical protein
VATHIVVRRFVLPLDDLLRIAQLARGPRAHFIEHCRLKVHKHGARDVLTRAGLREESVERIVADTDRPVQPHLPLRLNAMLEALQL